MKTFLKLSGLAAIALALLLGCAIPSFSGTDLSTTVKEDIATGANFPQITGGTPTSPMTVSISSALTIGSTTNNYVTLTFANGNVDASSLTGVSFYNLLGTAAADGAYARDNALTPTTTVQYYTPAANSTTVTFTFDMTNATDYSDNIEVFVDPAVLTANSGSKKLNIDSDGLQGEAGDDDYVAYAAVTGGTKATAAGVAKTPRTALSFTLGALPTTTGVTTISSSYNSFAVDATDYTTMFDAAFTLQKFDATAGAWVDVSVTSTYTPGTGAYVVTIPVTVEKDIYRWKTNYSATFVTTATINGYTQKGTYSDSLRTVYSAVATVPEAVSTYSAVNVTASSSFQSSKNGVVTVTFGGIGTEGLSGVTAGTVKLYDSTNGKYVPVSSITKTAYNVYKFILQPGYASTGGTLEVQIAPTVTDLGNAVGTTDDLNCGDWTNVTLLPFGWKHDSTGTGTI